MLGDPDADEIWEKDIEALKFAITALCSMPEAGEPIDSPPAHIDRSEWIAGWKEYTGADAGFHYCSACKQQAFNYEDGGEIFEVLSNFCPNCGRPLTEEAWTELKRRIVGGCKCKL